MRFSEGGRALSANQRAGGILLAALALLAAFGIITADIQRESLWMDEAWTAWAVQSPFAADTLERIYSDVHPPLYFLLLDAWTLATGESVYALRLPSALAALVGLAATYTIGRQVSGGAAGLMALLLLATASFFVYYAREARMYSLLLALAALATWAYLRWRSRPSWQRALVYAALLAGLLYTHYAGALVILTHGVHLLLVTIHESGNRRSFDPLAPTPLRRIRGRGAVTASLPVPTPNSGGGKEGSESHKTELTSDLNKIFVRYAAPYALALLLFAPWLPVFLTQIRDNPNGPLAIPVPTDWGTVAALALILTSGAGWLFLALVVLALPAAGTRHISSRRLAWTRYSVSLLALWLLLTPVVLLVLNVWVAPVYQVRYTIAILPAGAMLAAYALRRARLPGMIGTRYSVSLQVILLLTLIYVQLAAYPALWPDKPPWEAAFRQLIAARDPQEPIITDFAPYSPAGYYDRTLPIRQGVSLDLSWRLHHAGELRALADLLRDAPSVWVALPTNTAKVWHITAALNETRGVGYRAGLANMIFYRFDRDQSDNLRFRFGEALRYAGGAGANVQFDVTPGAEVCSDYRFTALSPLKGEYSAALHIVDITGNLSAAQHDTGLGIHDTGETIRFSPCLTIPAETPPGYYHLELSIYRWATGHRLPVVEDGGGEGVNWGDVMRLAAVHAAGQ